MKTIKLLGIVGSLRRKSYNLALLNAAAKLLPPETELEIITLENLPLFNQDLENTEIPAVTALKAKIEAADAIIFSSPEYNHSIPGVLKNAIDLASRPWGSNSFTGKPAAIMGASIGNIATARMQSHLRQVMSCLNMQTLNQPEILVGMTQDKVDENGEIYDEQTKEKILELLASLVEWTKKLA